LLLKYDTHGQRLRALHSNKAQALTALGIKKPDRYVCTHQVWLIHYTKRISAKAIIMAFLILPYFIDAAT
jgi:hypothetical protein